SDQSQLGRLHTDPGRVKQAAPAGLSGDRSSNIGHHKVAHPACNARPWHSARRPRRARCGIGAFARAPHTATDLSDFAEMEQLLANAARSKQLLIVTEDDAHNIIDIRSFSPGDDWPLPPLPSPESPPRL